MPPRRKPKTSLLAAPDPPAAPPPPPSPTFASSASFTAPGPASPSTSTTTTTRTRTRTASRPQRQQHQPPPTTSKTKTKVYERAPPAPLQLTFPPRRRVVKTYGRRSLPAMGTSFGGGGSDGNGNELAEMRQQTLTQVGYVRSSSGSGSSDGGGGDGGLEGGLRVENEDKGEGDDGGGILKWEGEGVELVGEGGGGRKVEGKGKGKRRGNKNGNGNGNKRRRTMGEVERGSSFYTQTLTQFLGVRSGREDDALRVEDEGELDRIEDEKVFLGKQPSFAAKPRTPSNKRIKVDIYEVPSSQPTPFTPLLDRYSPLPGRSPLREKSTNMNVSTPTGETTAKRPRTLVIQDSYSQGSSAILPSSFVAGGSSPAKKEEPDTISGRRPLAEIPVSSLELGAEGPSIGDEDLTPTTRRVLGAKRTYIEIPDSDDELESLGSTPLQGPSTQQTPSRRSQEFGILKDPQSASRSQVAGASETPASQASLGRSDKENDDGAAQFGDDGESTASEEEGPGTPTPKNRSQAARDKGRPSQSKNPAPQVRRGSWQNVGNRVVSYTAPHTISCNGSTSGEAPRTSTPGPRNAGSQAQVKVAEGADGPAVHFEDEDPTASEDEEGVVPAPVLKKSVSPHQKRKATPEVPTSEDSTADGSGKPTPVARKVQIEFPSSSVEELCKETPRKPAQKSSPIYQRQTQARSQYYSQGLESQRVPLEVIQSLGPQTDRSDILISLNPTTVDEIVQGMRDHEFRTYKFPVQVSRCWIYTTQPVNEVKYMATLGPAAEPGEIDNNTGLGNAEFNAGTSDFKFAHKLVQVYQLNNPVPLADMPDNGLGDGPPQRYRYVPPAIVGQLLANLRCALFAEGDEEEGGGMGEDGGEEDGGGEKGIEAGVTISQELEEQLRSDILHTTQLLSSAVRPTHQEEDVIPASQGSPVLSCRSTGATRTSDAASHLPTAAAPAPARSSQRIRNRNDAACHHHHHQQQQSQPSYQKPQPQAHSASPKRTPATHRPFVRPSQATTASYASSSPDHHHHARSSSASLGAGYAGSVLRPPPASSEPDLPDLDLDLDVGLDMDANAGPLTVAGLAGGARGRFEFGSGSAGHDEPSSLPLPLPDSLLVDADDGEGMRRAPEPVVWDSEEDEVVE
ncbi:hypothetical protein VTK26DRAFT_5119 [Humicola hyalothermophila]